jgi:hypothetical protein
VNCTEAQVLLAAHRELNNIDVETAELDAHLEHCASCRLALARYSLIGEQVRSLPTLEPSPDAYAKLMQALAAEHSQLIQRSPSVSSPPPEFLKPYLREHAYSSVKTNPLAAFSSAATGPLPVFKAVRKKRRSSLGQFAVIGLAAVFLMALMMGGITSLLLVAHDHVTPPPALSVNNHTDVAQVSYMTTTAYINVVSAVADRTSIYYTAYGNDNNSGWMLEQLDRTTKISTPLLASAGNSPLIVLGSANGWLVWLQFDEPKISKLGVVPNHTSHSLIRTWSLRYLSLNPVQGRGIVVPNQPVTLLSGSFDQNAVASWIHTPIQGIWFIQNTLLVATVDENGTSHLVRYPLGSKNNFAATEIAKASSEHVITSPTANSDGTQIYWAEEWQSIDENLHSNVWTQQVVYAQIPSRGHAARYKMTIKQAFLENGMSFTPLVVNGNLFLLSTANGTDLTQAVPNGATSTSTPGPVATPNTSTSPLSTWANNSFYSIGLDAAVRGTLVMYPLSDSPAFPPTLVSALGSASSLQAGNDFVLWQNENGDGSYKMYDTVIKSNINVGDVLNDAQFLAVNGDTAVWTNNTTVDTTSRGVSPSATLVAFSWPMK